MSKRPSVIKQLSNMEIDEISLVDRGANQHALISFAKSASGVDQLFEKARGGRETDPTNTGENSEDVEEFSGDDPADVVDDYVANDGHGDTGAPAGKTIGGTEKKKAKNIMGRSAPAGTAKGVSKSLLGTEILDNDDYLLAKALGVVVDDYEVGKNFGPQQPFPQQQQGAPQFGNPPAMQTVGAQPFGQGVAQPPAAPAPGMPGMPGAAPAPGQGAPPQLGTAQLPPEAVAYIQQLEKKLAELQGSSAESGESKPEGSDSSSGAGDSDNSNKPFGKSGDYNVDENLFLEELSKAIGDEQGEVSKALQARFEAYEGEIAKANAAVQAERDLRLEREFIAKAAEFNVPVAADELGPVLKRAAEALDIEDFSVIVKCLDAATELSDEVYGEVGKRGTGTNLDLFSAVELEAEELTKNYDVDGATAISAVFEANPSAYDQYLANRRQGL